MEDIKYEGRTVMAALGGPEITNTGRGTYVQQARLWSGLILLTYVTFHFINHALGLISLDAMEGMLFYMSFVWASIPGTIALYGAFAVHIALGLWAVINITTLRMPLWRWAQLLLGLAIPYWLISHIFITRGSELLTGNAVTYLQEFGFLWPAAAIRQNALLLIVWLHGMFGIHFWLRPKRWYREVFVLFLSFAIIVPVLAISGWITAAQRELLRVRTEPTGQAAENLQNIMTTARQSVSAYTPTAQMSVIAVLCAVAVLFIVFYVAKRLRPKVRVSYGQELTVETSPGKTILDVSREAGLPHMSVCGGRARCSTCRVMVISDEGSLSPIGYAEQELLDRINAAPNMRLACQAKVLRDTEIRPIIQPQRAASTPLKSDPFGWGRERELAVIFLNIRDFSAVAAKSLPYDTVFILNHFFDLVVAEIEAANGYVEKFTGDGLVAIFGLQTSIDEACRSALMAAANCHRAAQRTDSVLAQHMSKLLDIGVGIHVGKVVIGRIGKTSDQTAPSRITAIGEVVNIAEAFEKITKKLKAGIIYSQQVHDYSGLGMAELLGEVRRIKVNEVAEPINAVIIQNSRAIRTALETQRPTHQRSSQRVLQRVS